MARPRSFDAEAVLNAAQELFWQRGYQASSLDELARITGVNKPSLYAAFGDKAQLFLRVLGRYHTMVLGLSEQMLRGGPSPKAAVRAWLTAFLPFCSGQTGERGCLSLNTGFEAAVLSEAVHASVAAFQRDTEALLHEALACAQTRGELPPAFDCDSAARVLLVAQSGLMALARGRPPADETLSAMYRLLDAVLPD